MTTRPRLKFTCCKVSANSPRTIVRSANPAHWVFHLLARVARWCLLISTERHSARRGEGQSERKEQKIRIEASSGLSDNDIDKMVKDAEKTR